MKSIFIFIPIFLISCNTFVFAVPTDTITNNKQKSTQELLDSIIKYNKELALTNLKQEMEIKSFDSKLNEQSIWFTVIIAVILAITWWGYKREILLYRKEAVKTQGEIKDEIKYLKSQFQLYERELYEGLFHIDELISDQAIYFVGTYYIGFVRSLKAASYLMKIIDFDDIENSHLFSNCISTLKKAFIYLVKLKDNKEINEKNDISENISAIRRILDNEFNKGKNSEIQSLTAKIRVKIDEILEEYKDEEENKVENKEVK